MGLSRNFAKSLTRLLKERHITQTALSKQIGVNSQTVNMYCNDNSSPDYEKLLKIAEILDVTTDELLTGIAPENMKLHKDIGLSGPTLANLRAIKEGEFLDRGTPILSRMIDLLFSSKDFYLCLYKAIDMLILNDELQFRVDYYNKEIQEKELNEIQDETVRDEIKSIKAHNIYINDLKNFGAWNAAETLKDFFIKILHENTDYIIHDPAGWIEPTPEQKAVPEA